MIQERTVLCGKCSRSVPISEVRYVPKSGSMPTMMCTSCRDSWEGKGSVKSGTKSSVKSVKQDVKENRKLFLCSSCSYKFRFNTLSSARLKCPFCGKSEYVSEYKSTFSEDLLKSV